MPVMGKANSSTIIYLYPIKFADLKHAVAKDIYLDEINNLPSQQLIKQRLQNEDLNSLYLIARHIENNLYSHASKPQKKHVGKKLKGLYTLVIRLFNNRLRHDPKFLRIKADAEKYIRFLEPEHTKGRLARAWQRVKRYFNWNLLQLYENHYSYVLNEIQKNILLRKFSTLSDKDKLLFLTNLFPQSDDIIQKVINSQSLYDLDLLKNHSIPQHQKRLVVLQRMIDEYLNTVRFSTPNLKAERYLNTNRHHLFDFPQLNDKSYERCQIDPDGPNYIIRLISGQAVNSIPDVEEKIILHYAIESTLEENLCKLKNALFPDLPDQSRKTA